MNSYMENCVTVEEDAKYSLSILESVFDASYSGILIVNCEGKVVKFNNRFIEMWNIPDTVSCLMDDREFLKCVSPNLLNPEVFNAEVERIYNSTESVISLIEFKNDKVFESYSMPQKINNIIVGRVWSFIDITLRKKQERELVEKEERYFKAFMLSPDAITITRLSDGIFVSVNKGFTDITGYSDVEIIGKSSLDLLFWNNVEDRDYVVNQLLTDSIINNFETIFKVKKGKISCLFSASLIELKGVKHILSVIKDITGKIQERTYKKILTNTLLLLNKPTDLKSTISSIASYIKNKGKFTAVGIRIESNKDFPFFVHDGFTEEFIVAENTLHSNPPCLDTEGNPVLECICGKVITEKCNFWTDDSSNVDISVTNPRLKCIKSGYSSMAIIPISIENKVEGLIYINSVKKNKFNYEIIEYLEILASYIGMAISRNRDKEQKLDLELKLWNTQRMDSIGLLASGIANDLNNIFFPILGISELLLNESKAKTPENDSLKQIVDLTKKGSSLIKQILEFSGKSNNKKMIIPPRMVIEKALAMVKSTLSNNIILKLDIDNCDSIYADSTQIYQVVVNLLLNASQAIKGRGIITISLKQTIFESNPFPNRYLPAGRYIVLKVTDTGEGIPKENISKVFDPFFSTKKEGTGLGLSVVHGVIREHSGDIRVFSEEVGTSFIVYLPNNKRLMLIDDEKSIIEMEKHILEKEGFSVSAFENSEEALKTFRENPDDFDLIITDRFMPIIDGDQLIKEVQSKSDIPILVCTGFCTRDYETELKKLNINLLLKPFSLSTLVETINKRLKGILNEESVFGRN